MFWRPRRGTSSQHAHCFMFHRCCCCCMKMDVESELQAKIEEYEGQVAALKKENTRLKNEMRFNLDQEKRSSGEYIASLQRDVDELDARNQDLSSILMRTEAELKTARLSQARSESSNSAKLAAQSAALVERLSSVQREREKALATQLRTALEQKERLQHKLQQHGDGSSEDLPRPAMKDMSNSCEEDLQCLLDQLRGAKGVFELQKNGHLLVQKVRQMKEENRKRIQEQIEMLKKESEEAIAKERELESQIHRLKRELEMMETEYKLVDKTRVKTLQAQLHAAMIEKEEWQNRAAKFEDTCDTLRLLSSLQRSLSKEDDIKRKYEAQLQKACTENAALMEKLESTLQERNIAAEELNEMVKERNAFALQAQQEFERAERFQRLVFVLRKKAVMSSAGTTPPSVTPSFDDSV